MVNMNKFKDPCIYGLTAPGVGVFYVGYTSINAKNRWWQHISRANSGHESPVYKRMRELGVSSVDYKVLERVADPSSAFELEAQWIKKLCDEGANLSNMTGRDGTPHSLPEVMRKTMGLSRRGVPTWIKGKKADEAGWTEARRIAQAETRLRKRADSEILEPEKLFRRVEREEIRQNRLIVKVLMESLPKKERRRSRNIVVHGTRTMYEKYGCKCEKCRNCMAQHNARKRGNPDWQNVIAKPLKSSE